ncbi:murein biosynthesis integral membrane protein MurJ [Fonticella tunisiensis]|uniref:Probable lipid II flippase MurJ n=1 Tax=Fonticella tunisiensis TaxID=1096341 RepID=A0A4R7KAC0_9CLOT|nr:murein biosynthesis integral membrane protein MurJ [Fonticella tunisiensis]TDT50814.1 putative peptidoglycan lipid II flippase [Fonticella tunisiensis]
MTRPKGENIKRATFMLMITLFLSRILGFVREMITARVFGSNYVTDAFFAAFTIPDVLFDLLISGALSSGFMPVFNSYLAEEDEEGAWNAANTFITVSMIFIIVFNLLGMVFARYLVPFVAAGMTDNQEGFKLTVKLTRIMFSAVTFTVLAGLIRGILNSYKRFTIPSLGPMLYNVGIILGALLLGRKFGIYGMAVGVVAGAILNVAVQLPEFLAFGKRFRLELNTKNAGYRRMLRLMGPAIIGLALARLNLVVNQNIASFLDDGSITALRYAQRIMMLPIGIFGASISTTIFPEMSMHIAKKEIEEFKDTLLNGLKTLMFIIIPATAGIMAISEPVVRLLFKSGKFMEQDVKVTAFALSFYAIGIIGQSAVPIIIRGFYAIQDTKTPVKVGAIAFAANVILNLIFVKFSNLAIGGIAFSSSLTSILQMILLYKLLARRFDGLRTKELMISTSKATIASIIMGAAAFGISKVVEGSIGTASKMAQLIDAGTAIAVGMIIYILAAYALKMGELDFAVGTIKRKFKK